MFSPNEKLTDASSVSDFIFLGDYFDEPSIFNFNDDIWGSRIPPLAEGDEDHP